MIPIALALVVLLIGGMIGYSRWQESRRQAQRERRHLRFLEVQRLWEASTSQHTSPAAPPASDLPVVD